MKALIAVAVLAAMASPALANSKTHHHAAKAYAYVPRHHVAKTEGPICRDPNAVCVQGLYIGSDPDPFIRSELLNEFYRHALDY